MTKAPKLHVDGVNIYYGEKRAIKDVDLAIHAREVTAFIGPSGCGKSTLLRAFNRMNDTIEDCRTEGSIRLDQLDVLGSECDVPDLRRRVGMVFQQPVPFPKSIFENVAYGLRIAGERGSTLADKVERALKDAALWSEVEGDLGAPALGLSGGQQQRLCIARALANEPEVLLMDEPTSALDPRSTAKLEELVQALGEQTTVVVVTHNMQQAQRVAHRTAFFYLGEMVECAPTATLFASPEDERTRDYVKGVFG